MTDKEKELLLKIKALADKGIGGEKQAAEKKLKQLMKKLNVTYEELIGNASSWYDFKLKKDAFLNKMFFQILANIYDIYTNNVQYIKHDTCNISVYIPADIAIELEAKYDFYCKMFKKDLEAFYLAFINANHLWDSGSREGCDREWTEEERRLRVKAATMSQSLDKHNYNKQLEYKG